MAKRPSWRAKAMYIVFALALVVGLVPLMAIPVAAQPPVVLVPDYENNVWCDAHHIETSGFLATDTFVSWVVQSVPPLVTSTSGLVGTGPERFIDLTPTTIGSIDCSVTLNYIRGAVPMTAQAVKQWGEDARIVVEQVYGSNEVRWVENDKELVGGPKIIKLTDFAVMPTGNEEPANGAIVHWFMVTSPTDCATVSAVDPNAVAPVQSTLQDALGPGPNQVQYMNQAATLLGVDTDDLVWYVRSVTADNPNVVMQDPDADLDMGNGTSWIEVMTSCEGLTRIVAVVEYPCDFSNEIWKVQRFSINWWTQQLDKVPQVRWAGEKIVLEKEFGTNYIGQDVSFKLDGQSIGLLEGVYVDDDDYADTIWTTVQSDGVARCILTSEETGEADVTATLWDNDVLTNQHGFVVYFLKLESIELSEVLGERVDCPFSTAVEGHDSGIWNPENPWDTEPLYADVATGGTGNTLIDAAAAWTPDIYADQYVAIVDGTGAGQVRRIVSNTANTLTVAPYWEATDFDSAPDATSVYQIGGDLNRDRNILSPTYDEAPVEIINVSQDGLLRVRVKGWFMGSDLSVMNEGYPWNRDLEIGWVDVDRDGFKSGFDYWLPEGRWIVPQDWPNLAGPNWKTNRPHWDIMDNPIDNVMSDWDEDCSKASELGDYLFWGTSLLGYDEPQASGLDPADPDTTVVAEADVIGPYSTIDTYLPWVNSPVLDHKTIVQNGLLESWDAPMPPAKIEFQVTSGPGFFKAVDKGDIYYEFVDISEDLPPADDGIVYTLPFYAENIPASALIPPYINNGGYDWNSFGFMPGSIAQGPYDFWTKFNVPDQQDEQNPEQPRIVEVYTDNHGEAMVWLNGLDVERLQTEMALCGGLDAPLGLRVADTTVLATVDYPYLRGKHPKLVSNTLVKTLEWGKSVLGADIEDYMCPPQVPNYEDPFDTLMLFQVDDVLCDGVNDGLSKYKMAFIWVSDQDGQAAIGERVDWRLTGSGGMTSGSFADGWNKDPSLFQYVSSYWDPCPPIPGDVQKHLEFEVVDGFLADTNGSYPLEALGFPGPYYQAVSYLRAPTDYEKSIFEKFQTLGTWPDGLDVDDYAVGAVVLFADDFAAHSSLTILIDEPVTGTITRTTNVNWGTPADTDDPIIRGDADMNGKVNMGDVTMVERMVLGLNLKTMNADANKTKAVDMGDVTKIERIILGLD